MGVKRFRRIFPVTKKKIYLDHVANGPCSTLVSKAIQQILSEWSSEGVDWVKSYHHVSQAKNLFAKLIDADPEEIAMVSNTSTGVSPIDEVKRLGLELTTRVDPNQRAGIVNFKVRNLPAVMNRLRKNRIAVSSRGGGVRVSHRFYNTIEELDSLLSVLRTK